MHLATYGENNTLKVTKNDQFFHEMTTAYRQQQQIGFNMIWRALLSQKFGCIQETTYRIRGYDYHFTGTSWARMVVFQIIKFFEIVWKERNKRIIQDSQQGLPIYLQHKIKKILSSDIVVPSVILHVYNKGEKLATEKMTDIGKFR